MNRVAFVFATALVCTFAVENFAQPAPTTSPADLFRNTASSVVLVSVHDQNMKLIGSGSAFFVSDDGLLVTNFHVVDGACFAFAESAEMKSQPVEGILAIDRDADLALLQLSTEKGRKGLRLNPALPPVGTKVFAIGSPRGLTNTLSEGLVSGHRQRDKLATLIQTTAAISPGSSGGPLLNADGEVVGVITSFLTESQNLNFAVPAARVRALIASRGPLRKLGAALAAIPDKGDEQRLAEIWSVIQSGENARALKMLQELRPRLSGTYEYLFATGVVQIALGNYDMAIDSFDGAIKAAPTEPFAYQNLSLCYAEMGRDDDAILALRKSVSVAPDFIPGYRMLSYRLYRQAYDLSVQGAGDKAAQRYEEAIDVFKRVVAESPANPTVYHTLAEFYSRLGRQRILIHWDTMKSMKIWRAFDDHESERNRAFKPYEQAASALKSAIDLDPRDAQAFLDLAELYANIKQAYDNEQNVFRERDWQERTRLIGTRSDEFFDKLSELERDAKIKSAECYERVSHLRPDDLATKLKLGLAYLYMDETADCADEKKALAIAQEMIRQSPNDAEGYGLLSSCYKKLRRFDDAIEAIRTELKIRPDNPDADTKEIEELQKLARYDLGCDVPRGWISQVPINILGVIASYRAPSWKKWNSPRIEIRHPSIPGFEGLPRDVTRFVGQYAQGFGISQSAIKLEKSTTNGLQCTVFEVSGHWRGLNDEHQLPYNHYLLLAAFVEGPNGPWLIHVLGPATEVREFHDDFFKLVRSAKLRK